MRRIVSTLARGTLGRENGSMNHHPVRVLLLACALAASGLACKPSPSAPAVKVVNGAGPLAERMVEVKASQEGFVPSRIEARPREPLLLRFTRTAEVTCADSVVVAGDPKKHDLPLGLPVDLRVVAPESGALAFSCGMHMYKGSVVVQQ